MIAMQNENNPHAVRALRWLAWGGAACLLLAPAIAMRLQVEGVDWSVGDFVVMGVILAAACGAFELVLRMSGDWLYRAGGAIAILAGLALVWVNLAVGLVGEGPNAYNLGFMAVLGVGVVGALLARFRAAGLSRALLAMAIVHAMVAATALATHIDPRGASLSAAWLAPWLLAASLFRMSGTRQKV